MQSNRRYWIIGGEYEDTRYENMRRGSHSVLGPFEDLDLAERTWRSMAAEAPSPRVRYTIAVDPA
jgi:hypothetical protein